MQVTISVDDVVQKYAEQLAAMGNGAAKKAMSRALVHTGDKAKTQVVRTLTDQTGLKRKVLVRAVKPRMVGDLTFALETKGGNIALKYFNARETQKGVSANPWNARKLYGSTFIKGGLFPNRVALSRGGGQVFKRVGKGRLPIQVQKSGLYIPKELLKGETVAAWEALLKTDLATRVEKEISYLLGGG